MGEHAPADRVVVARSFRLMGYLNTALVTVLIGGLVLLTTLRERDLNHQLADQRASLIQICGMTAIIDTLVVQIAASLRRDQAVEEQASARVKMGHLIAVLDTYHDELSVQKPCEDVQ